MLDRGAGVASRAPQLQCRDESNAPGGDTHKAGGLASAGNGGQSGAFPVSRSRAWGGVGR